MAAGGAGSRGSGDAPPLHASPPHPQSPAMLSPRAAAFSVEALLTGQEENEGAGAPPGVKAKNSEDAAGLEASEVPMGSQSAAEGAATPTHVVDGAPRVVNSPHRDGGNDRDASPHASDENTDDEDLLVDVEDCSSELMFKEGRRGGERGLRCRVHRGYVSVVTFHT